MDNFLETNEFDPKRELPEYKKFEYFELPRRYNSLINFCTWAAIINLQILYYLITVLTSGSIIKVLLAISVIGIGNTYNLNYYLQLFKFINSIFHL